MTVGAVGEGPVAGSAGSVRPAGPAGSAGSTGSAAPPAAGRGSTAARRQALGRYGEDVALRHLCERGLVLLDRNWRCPAGEIDLVLRDGPVLVVCEVKTRSSTVCGDPLEGVTASKVARLRRLAALWLHEHPVHPHEVRLDMVGVLRPRRGPAVVEHVRGLDLMGPG